MQRLFVLIISFGAVLCGSAQNPNVMRITSTEGRKVSVDVGAYDGADIFFKDNMMTIVVDGIEKSVEFGQGLHFSFSDAEPDYQKSVSEVGYATYTPAEDVIVPIGVEVYTVTEIGDSSVVLSAKGNGVIPGGEGVLLKAEKGSYVFKGATFPHYELPSWPENLLVGALQDVSVNPYSVYTLGIERTSGILGFWQFAGNLIKGETAYLGSVPLQVPTRGFAMIANTLNADAPILEPKYLQSQFFNLYGMRISGKEKEMIQIRDGKKIVLQRQ